MGPEGKTKGHMMMCPMCAGMAAGMTRVRLAATSDGGATVSVIRPTVAMQMVDSPQLKAIAEEVEAKLHAAFASIG